MIKKLIIIIFSLFFLVLFSNFAFSFCPPEIDTPNELRSQLRTLILNFLSDPTSSPYYDPITPTAEIRDLLNFYKNEKDKSLITNCDTLGSQSNKEVFKIMEKTIVFVPSNVDLDVLYLEKTPRYNRYNVDYSLGYPRLLPGTENDQRWPNVNEIVTFTVHVKNIGEATVPIFEFQWSIDNIMVSSGTHSNLAPGDTIQKTLAWLWEDGNHNVKFVVDPENLIYEKSKDNNEREDRTNSLSFRLHVEQRVYDTFNSIQNIVGTFSFEDWAQAHIDALNQKIIDSGGIERARIDQIVIESDGTLPRGGTHAPVNWQWDGSWGFETDEWKNADVIEWAPKIQAGLIHEWTHQIGMAHSYDANIDIAANNLITNNILIQRNPDIVGLGGDDTGRAFEENLDLTPYFIFALDSNFGYRRGFYADYLFDIPDTNMLQVQDAFGNPLNNVQIKIWQSSNKRVSGNPVFVGTTDLNGEYVLPNQQLGFGPITTATGHTLKDNPFGVIDVNAINGLFLMEITVGTEKDYQILTVHDFNIAYRRGFETTATYIISTNLVQNADPTNLALNKPSSAVTNNNLAIHANDGDKTDSTKFWEPFNAEGKIGDWWKVDLEGNHNIYKVDIYSWVTNTHDWYSKFHIDVSTDGNTWTTVATENNWDISRAAGQVVSYTFNPIQARYVRIVSDIDQNFVKLQEVEVFRII